MQLTTVTLFEFVIWIPVPLWLLEIEWPRQSRAALSALTKRHWSAPADVRSVSREYSPGSSILPHSDKTAFFGGVAVAMGGIAEGAFVEVGGVADAVSTKTVGRTGAGAEVTVGSKALLA